MQPRELRGKRQQEKKHRTEYLYLKIKSKKKKEIQNMFYRNCCWGNVARREMVENKMQENAFAWFLIILLLFKKGRTLYEKKHKRRSRMFALVAFSLHPPTTSIYVRAGKRATTTKKN